MAGQKTQDLLGFWIAVAFAVAVIAGLALTGDPDLAPAEGAADEWADPCGLDAVDCGEEGL